MGLLGWQRLAVTPEQAAEAGLPPKPGTDRRYRDGHPHISYEAEALGQAALNRLLAGWLDALLPVSLADVLEREQAEREQLRALLDGGGVADAEPQRGQDRGRAVAGVPGQVQAARDLQHRRHAADDPAPDRHTGARATR